MKLAGYTRWCLERRQTATSAIMAEMSWPSSMIPCGNATCVRDSANPRRVSPISVGALMQDAHRWEVRRRALSQLPSQSGSCRDPVGQALVGHAVQLLEQGLGVDCAGRGCDAGENRQGDQGGYDGLHGCPPGNWATPRCLPTSSHAPLSRAV